MGFRQMLFFRRLLLDVRNEFAEKSYCTQEVQAIIEVAQQDMPSPVEGPNLAAALLQV